MDKVKIVETLKQRGYDEKSANLVANDLLELKSPLDKYLQEWIDDGIIRDFKTNNYSITCLMKDRSMTYPAALLTIDWIIKEPDKALKSLISQK